MKRRRFLEQIGAAALSAGLLPAERPGRRPCAPSQRGLKNWTWVHGNWARDAAEWRRHFVRIRDGGVQGVLISGDDSLPVRVAQDVGLEAHRWIWVLNRNGDAWAKEHHPEWYTVSRNGASSLEHPPYVGYYQWVCPTRGPVRDYLSELVERIASTQEVDGVHFDYIRHADVILPIGLWPRYNLVQDREYPEFDFCYCDVCRARFRDETGVDPTEMDDPTSDVAWREFRWDTVTELVRLLTGTVHAVGKRVSAAVFPTPRIARRLVRQAWDEWPLDDVFPMVYHGFYNEDVDWIGRATRDGVAAVGADVPLYSGLYLPHLSPAELHTAVRSARDGGAAGVSLFEMGQLSDEHLERFKDAVSGAW